MCLRTPAHPYTPRQKTKRYMGFVLYAPALALEAIAGWATYKTILVCGILATGIALEDAAYLPPLLIQS